MEKIKLITENKFFVYSLLLIIIILLVGLKKIYFGYKKQIMDINVKHNKKLENQKEEQKNLLDKEKKSQIIIIDKEKEKYLELKSYIQNITNEDGESFVRSRIDRLLFEHEELLSNTKNYVYPQAIHNLVIRKKTVSGEKLYRQIDHLIISKYGLLAIETKHYTGDVYICGHYKGCKSTDLLTKFFPKLAFGQYVEGIKDSRVITIRNIWEKEKKYLDYCTVRKDEPLKQIISAIQELDSFEVENKMKKFSDYSCSHLVAIIKKPIYNKNIDDNTNSKIEYLKHFKEDSKYGYAITEEEINSRIEKFLKGELLENEKQILEKKDVESIIKSLKLS